jgi:hypothetical protein
MLRAKQLPMAKILPPGVSSKDGVMTARLHRADVPEHVSNCRAYCGDAELRFDIQLARPLFAPLTVALQLHFTL